MVDFPPTSRLQSRRSSIDVQRRALLHWLLVLTVVFTFGFAVLNLVRGIVFLALLESAVAVFSAVLLLVLPRVRNIQPLSMLYMLLLFAMLVAALLTPGLSDKVFVWFFLIPVMAHFLHGRHLGMIVSLTLLAIAWLLYYRFHFTEPDLLDMVGFTNVVACSLVLSGGVYAYELAREQAEERLHRLASTDSLTGLPNRKHLREMLDYTLDDAAGKGASFSVLEMDLDHFKAINDQYGHDIGDQVLQAVANALRERLRAADTPARWGGEEFLVLLPETDREGARHVAESIRQTLGELEFRAASETLNITASIGVTAFPRDGTAVRELLLSVDNRLYEAKNGGRDRVVG